MAVPYPNPTSFEEMQANRRHLNAVFFTRRPRMKDRMPEQPAPVVSEPQPTPEAESLRPAVSDRAAKIIDAVATAAEISVDDMMVDQTKRAAAARQVAVVVLIRSIVAEPTQAAMMCGLTFGAANRALSRFDAIIDGEALPIVNAPSACVARLWRHAMVDLQINNRTATFGDCLAAVSRATGVKAHDIKTERRTKHLVKARQIAMWLGTQFTLLSLPSLGRSLGGRDHTMVLYGSRSVAQIAETIEAADDWGLQEWADALWAADWDVIRKRAA